MGPFMVDWTAFNNIGQCNIETDYGTWREGVCVKLKQLESGSGEGDQ